MLNLTLTTERLRSGLTITMNDLDSPIEERVSLSDGISQLDPDLDLQYSHPAFIPKLPWRQPTVEELERLTDRADRDNCPTQIAIGRDNIAIVKFPSEVIAGVKDIIDDGESKYGESLSADLVTNHPDYALARERIEAYIRDRYAVDPQLDCRGLIRRDINLSTSTVNEIEFLPAKLFAGLHLDSWDYLPFRLRHRSRNRICINLGREVRYFLLINLTLDRLFDALDLVDPDDIYRDYRGVRLANKFMQAHPDYPVVKLAVYPGEAYIAPTENFIHDATSIGKIYPDWSLTFLGRFQVK